MNRSLRVPAIAAGVAVSVLVLASALGSWRAVGPRSVIPAAIGTICAAVAATLWVRYRSTADPHALFVAVGFAVIAAQILVFAAVWPDLVAGAAAADPRLAAQLRSKTISASALGAYATQVGWLIGGVCFLFARPWRDRRGRRPVSPIRVVSTAVGAAILADVALIALDPSTLVSRSFERPVLSAAGFSTRVGLGTTGAVLLVLALVTLGAVVAREIQATSEEGTSFHSWLAVALTVAALGLVVSFARPLPFEAAHRAIDLIPLVGPILAFAGLLSTQKDEVSHLRRATDRAEEVLGGRAEIASMVAHEIRGPVTTIRGLASTGDRHWDKLPEAERREFFQLIDQESLRLLHIADQTSTALKVDAGTLTYTRRPTDLADVVREAVEQSSVRDHPVTLELETGVLVSLDRGRVVEAVRQLVENAANYSPAGAPIEVHVRSEADAGRAVVEVVDHGPGIPADRREAAFGKFPGFRPKGYEDVPGTGLGLFICRAHLREHGGDVTAVETSDGGTMLRVTLPNQGEEEHGR